MNNLWSTVKKGMLTLGMLGMSALPYAISQDAPKQEPKPAQNREQQAAQEPAVKPTTLQYARYSDALPAGTTFLSAGYGKAVKDMDGSNALFFGQFALPEEALSLGASFYTQSIKHKEAEIGSEFFDFGGGNTQTLDFIDLLRNDIDRKVIHAGANYRGFGIDFGRSNLKTKDLLHYDETSVSSTSGTDTFLDEASSMLALKTTTAALRYDSDVLAASLGFSKQQRTLDQRATDSGNIGSIPFAFSINDSARTETERSTFFASGAYTLVPELSVGADLASSNITLERETSHVEIQDGTVIDSSASATKDARNPFYARVNGIWRPAYLPLIVSAGVGGTTSNSTDDSQVMADLGLTLKASEDFGIYAHAGIDAEGEAYFTGALGKPRQETHDLGRFLADQRTIFDDEAAQVWDFQNRVHGLAQQGAIAGANVYKARDGFEPGEMNHIQPFIGIPFGDYGALTIVGNVHDEGGSGRARIGIDIGKMLGIDSFVLGADAGVTLLKNVATETAERPKLQYGEYAATLSWARKF
jgi:hypothetical protein